MSGKGHFISHRISSWETNHSQGLETRKYCPSNARGSGNNYPPPTPTMTTTMITIVRNVNVASLMLI